MLSRIRGRIVHKALDHVSPLAVPVMLEIGRESVYGEASEEAAGGSRGGTGEGGDAVTRCGTRAMRAIRSSPPAAVRDHAGDARSRSVGVAGRRSCRRALLAGEGLLVVADLHLEKGSSYAARGVLLPPYDTAATLARLAQRARALRAARR